MIALRRQRLSEAGLRQRVGWLVDLDIESDNAHDLDTALSLAIEYSLTYYDALYLELALRRRLPLATLDRAMKRAARQTGAELWTA